MIIPAYARLRSGSVARTVEVCDDIFADVDADDLILGVETLGGQDWRDALVMLAMDGRLTIPGRQPWPGT